ncbi:MAG: hypothetical protein AAGC54_12270, partial [Cyanobacteria bacterium P01_F01_bin.4]
RSKTQDKPKPELKPKFQRGGDLGRQQSWLKEQRDQVLAQARLSQSQPERTHERSHQPQRERQR